MLQSGQVKGTWSPPGSEKSTPAAATRPEKRPVAEIHQGPAEKSRTGSKVAFQPADQARPASELRGEPRSVKPAAARPVKRSYGGCTLQSGALVELNLGRCTSLVGLPASMGQLGALEEFNLTFCNLAFAQRPISEELWRAVRARA